ncbi:16S rRNA (cytosine(967)-C(5))-methyltransferase RsmB [Pasteurellaceae bacterium HPA106]|uniref:16S rRNA (cytosine(967)-C(5))-methyltransferase RsmB n=1 Tax=Spirabiliibacterium pneumoniae TaxID=221400 RepID=UPI001AAD70ED|nr:16S rRNA (cytosine(967)-C(5))-methyltransferase RsmB [Spirabiliibacterium pneumoniae]MBE2897000.1 16S rRNA (cytosine(967)-C(5))-methyltransferase RsmB [Spirabiliibacterium pneumoniae]
MRQTALSSRAAAAEIISLVLYHGQSLATLLPEYQGQIKAQDMPLLQELCFGICRVLPRLESITKILLNKPLKGKTRIVHCLLLVGLYQILYTRIPPHAAVDEVVNATKMVKMPSFRALVNGVLRRFLREQAAILAIVDQRWQTLHPEWLVNRLKQDYPNQWRDIIDANNTKPPMWLRVNPHKASVQSYLTTLAQHNIPAQCGEPDGAIRLAHPCAVDRLPHFADGVVSVQDCHAQWAALLLGAQDNEHILDACAAPGGKTTHILALAPHANVTALDIEPNRLTRVKENLARMGQTANVICGDATKPAQWLDNDMYFDRILLDAPCSATGVIRRHPDIKWLRQAQDIPALVELQLAILTALWDKLKVGGTLLYATCSLLKAENSQQIAAFLQRTPDAKLTRVFDENESAVGWQFLPEINGGDGFYYAKLIKTMI